MKKRLIQIANSFGLSVRSFEQACELARGNISNMSEDGTIGADKLSKIIDKFTTINPEWLLNGKGEMFRSETNKSEHQKKDSAIKFADNDFLLDRIEKLAVENSELKKEIERLKNNKSLSSISFDIDQEALKAAEITEKYPKK